MATVHVRWLCVHVRACVLGAKDLETDYQTMSKQDTCMSETGDETKLFAKEGIQISESTGDIYCRRCSLK